MSIDREQLRESQKKIKEIKDELEQSMEKQKQKK